DVEVGEVVIAGTTNLRGTVLMTICDLSRMRIRADVDESDVPLVRAGQPARVYLQADEGEPVAGSVERVAPKGRKDDEGVSFGARGRARGGGGRARSGDGGGGRDRGPPRRRCPGRARAGGRPPPPQGPPRHARGPLLGRAARPLAGREGPGGRGPLHQDRLRR